MTAVDYSDDKVKVGDRVTYRRKIDLAVILTGSGTVTSVGRVYLTVDGERVKRDRIATVNGQAVRL